MKTTWMLATPEILENRRVLSISNNLQNISANEAWEYAKGSRDVVVAVIDSGIDLNHEDLKNNIWVNTKEIANDGIDNEGNGYIDDINGWNFYDNTNNVQDKFGHGTHVAGIIGAEGGNNLGVDGVNWTVSILPLKFMNDSGYGNTGGAIAAMSYILKMKKDFGVNIVVVNNSWGGTTGYSSMLDSKVQELNDAGVICVTAAGNSAADNDISPRYPGSLQRDNIINVGALSYDGINLASYSNYGVRNVDIAAPGGSILSTIPGGYGYKTGTSMAAPHVAGAVALLKSVRPDLSIQQTKDIIFGSVDMVGNLFEKVSSGGKLNVGAGIYKALNMPYNINIKPTGGLYELTMNVVSGWAIEKDSLNNLIAIKLVVDGAEKGGMVVGSGERWSFSLDGLMVGNHSIRIYAQDSKSQEWVKIVESDINIPAPVVMVSVLKLKRLSGWAYSPRLKDGAVTIRVLINNRLVAEQIANKYRADTIGSTGSQYHGFSMSLNKKWYHKGQNDIQIQVFDPVSKQMLVAWNGQLRK